VLTGGRYDRKVGRTNGYKDSQSALRMKTQKMSLSIVLALTLATATSYATVIFNFSDVAGSSIQFNGAASSFQFDNNVSNGHQWWITSESGGINSALALQGSFGGGPWSYGPITVNGADEYAAVTQPAVLTINDGAGHLATANVAWVEVTTSQGIGGLNANLIVNLSNLAYAGANVDLLNFFSAPAGELSVSFQYNPAMSLTQLTTGTGPYLTSYSGSLTTVPEPGTMLLASLGGGLLLLLRSRRQAR